MQLEMKMLSQIKDNIRHRNAYKNNKYGCRDQALFRSKRQTNRNQLLKSLPVEELLSEVGYYEKKGYI